MPKNGIEQLIRNQWGSAEKERGIQVSGLIGIDTKPVVGSVSGWVQVGINLVADKMCYCKTRPSILNPLSENLNLPLLWNQEAFLNQQLASLPFRLPLPGQPLGLGKLSGGHEYL